MKKQTTLDAFVAQQIPHLEQVKGGIQSTPHMPVGNSGTGYIDWGEIDIRITNIQSVGKGQH